MADNKALKYGLIIGGGGLAVWGLTKLADLKGTTDRLSVNITNFEISDKGLEYLKFKIDLEIVNPTNEAIRLGIKSVKPYYDNVELGYSVPSDVVTEIKANSITPLRGIEIRIITVNLLKTGLVQDVFVHLRNLPILIEKLQQKVKFHLLLSVNGVEIPIEQGFGDSPKQLGLVAAGKRNIKEGSKYNYLFDKPQGSTTRVQSDGSVDDTVMWCGYVVRKYHKETEKLARFLQRKSKSQKELFKHIFDFCYNHIQYHLDRSGVEELRSPAMTWKDRTYGVDCDDFSMFIASILYNLKIPFQFRITKYGRPNYQHIYLIVPVEGGKHITIDPVLDTFNYEKPFTEKKDFDMNTLNLAGTGEGMGIPIEILAGTSSTKTDVDLLKIVYGTDLQGSMSGLGSVEDDAGAMLRYLKRLRNVYVTSPDYIKDFQNPRQAVKMLDYAIKYWNTNKREEAIEKLARIEDELVDNGEIKLPGLNGFPDDDDEGWEEDTEFSGTEPELAGYEYRYPEQLIDWEDDIEFSGTEQELAGFEYKYETPQWEEDFRFSGVEAEDSDYIYDYSLDGLGGRRRRTKKARKAARRARRVTKKTNRRARRKVQGGIFRRIGRGLKTGLKKVVRGIAKVGAAPIRIGFLAAMRANAGGISDKLKYAYLNQQQAIARNIDINEFRKLKKVHANIERIFYKMGGNKAALKRAILSGKRKNLRGFEELGGTISGINGFDGYELDLGFTGKEAENPTREYKYDNQVWQVDEDFSGVEAENLNFDYDYSFDGLEGRTLRFRKRKKASCRYFRRKRILNHILRNPLAREIIKKVRHELKDIQSHRVIKRHEAKQAFLTALAYNHNHIATILAIAYSSQEEAIKKSGISEREYLKIKQVLEATKSLLIKELDGNEKELKNAVLIGKDKPNLEGLGSVAAGAAAGLIGKIVSWLKGIKLKRKVKQEARGNYQNAGGSNQQWRQSGKKRFNNQWQSTSRSPIPETPEPVMNFSELINERLVEAKSEDKQAFLPGEGASMTSRNTIAPVDFPKEDPANRKPDKLKKLVKVGLGVLAVGATGAIGYGIYTAIQREKKETATKPRAGKTLSGTQAAKKKTPAKKTLPRKAATRKLSAITLN